MFKRNTLKEFRKKENLTQQEVADKLKISLIQYQFIELGRRNPSFEVLKKFKTIFPKASIDKIFLD
jgi:putative transcriptional regulator